MDKKVILSFLFILLFPALIFILSVDAGRIPAWIFSSWFVLLCLSTILYLSGIIRHCSGNATGYPGPVTRLDGPLRGIPARYRVHIMDRYHTPGR
jgi:hypothetical protein